MPERFSSTLPILTLTRPRDSQDWAELDRGPGYFTIPDGQEAGVRLFDADDSALATLIGEIKGVQSITYLNLAEGRKVSDAGLRLLAGLPQLETLNLSSTGITSTGMVVLAALTRLERLDLSFCNRITDPGLKSLRSLPNLEYLDVQGCVKLTQGGLARMNRPRLTIHRGGGR